MLVKLEERPFGFSGLQALRDAHMVEFFLQIWQHVPTFQTCVEN